MSDLAAFEREPYLTRLEAKVLRVGEEGGRFYAVLDDTLLYPEGGGQPCDHGRLGEVTVLEDSLGLRIVEIIDPHRRG